MKFLFRHSIFCFVLASSAVARANEQPFYTQTVEVQGVVVKAPASVDPRALEAAKKPLTLMLKNTAVAQRMQQQKAALAIIPRNAFITVLPEFARLRGKNDSNGNPYDSFKVRGAGAVGGQPVTATSEENLLQLKDDPFTAENITVHEVAHAVMNLSFTEEEKADWSQIYRAAKRQNFFPNTFAMTNQDEYFAELTQSCFEVNNEINSAPLIRERDPDAYEFLTKIYQPKPEAENENKE